MVVFPPLTIQVRFCHIAATAVDLSDSEFSEIYSTWLITHFCIPYKTVVPASALLSLDTATIYFV